jgi:phosphoglycerate dehydrogenase-like enzyme
MSGRSVVVLHKSRDDERAHIRDAVGSRASLVFLTDLQEKGRVPALRGAAAAVSWNVARELREAEFAALADVGLLQFLSAGVDHVPFESLPMGLTIASNVGGFAEPMAEHVLAMALALSKRLLFEHRRLAQGDFGRFRMNRMLRGGTCGILGFGGIGRETARLMRAMGMKVFAVNTSGQTTEPMDFIGTLRDLRKVLESSDVVVVCLPLTKATRGLIGARELEWMRPDAILINVARGEIIDEDELFSHLQSHPGFMAGIDAWWIEPFRQGEFRLNHPFFSLPNFLGSPHNSALTPEAARESVRRAVENVLRFLDGKPLGGVVKRSDYV